MADGTTKPISEIEVGDFVLAEDPETGEQRPEAVTHLWLHSDHLVDLIVAGEAVTTTEDHPFWNETDGEWQRADALEPGDSLITADRRSVRVGGLDESTARWAPAFNLGVASVHTYFVLVGDHAVLVHNQHTCGWQLRNADGTIRDSGSIVSGSRVENPGRLSWPQQAATHTEFKLMEDLATSVRPGDVVSLQGTLPPCASCRSAMQAFADEHGATVIYREAGNMNPWTFSNG